MIRIVKVLFCDNEHGTGDVTFPPLNELSEQSFIQPMTTRKLRAEAKKAGWKIRIGADYCDQCAEGV